MSNKLKVLFGASLGVIFTIIISCLTSVTFFALLASFTSKNIPVFTKIVENVEKRIMNPDKFLEEEYDEQIEKYIQMLDDSKVEGGVDIEKFKNEFEKYAEENQKNEDNSFKPGRTDVSVLIGGKMGDAEYSFESKGYINSDIETGDYEYNANTKATLDLSSITGDDYNGFNFSYNIDQNIVFDKKSNILYSKVNKDLISLLLEEDEPSYVGKWVYISLDDLLEYLDPDQEIDNIINLTDEQFNDIKKLIRSKILLPDVRIEEGKTFYSNRARCVSYTWDTNKIDAIYKYIRDEIKSFSDEDKESVMFLFRGVKDLRIVTCNDRINNVLYELSITGKFEGDFSLYPELSLELNAEHYDLNFNINKQFSDFGKINTIKMPTNAIDILAVIKRYKEEINEEKTPSLY